MAGGGNFRRGRFIPKNPQKYVGDVNKIIFRSSWEESFLRRIDQNPAVLQWASEEIAIQYFSPLDNKMHRYFPDFIVRYQNPNGAISTEIIEIKPYQQAVVSERMSDRDKQALIVNDAKWKAAAAFAEKNGATFRVITEKTLFKQGPAKPARKTKAKMPKLAKGAKK